ncbi:MAG: tRNA (adenosine(37)-N6)-dimethylallyltransferase MiaA [Candidatus Edwardsbacteria bacterium]|nr:tRNA (adenosine(37)-N6)-dimethylallyltransferase MiaA [Candidatus Edwardsbacteria bacterium]MBU1576101.1 tRNA (adenosine(37)-N6)-dimethylallyltransferase MiaA [Candidatus Edwardsbacteria bacterium]MBU2463143.1 tRNA (adenosine(37)-N6)-dimethylallyltransferase MiaA [Candidatus Edwardsbacteria bacterium]MBU2593801.1 tRNA (adenosine(37)-N6)-dimethylallyltransferase MiaA [Candidatus Edwardsbacteria bacterium]
MRPVMVIAGPTAVGKTRVALDLAEKMGAEIISADSRQVYKYLDIGTAKPSKSERQKAKHHLIDFLEPDAIYSAARFAVDARAVMDRLDEQGKRYVIAGGSGLYLKALIEGLSQIPSADENVRRELDSLLAAKGKGALYEMLKEIDPESAQRLKPNDAVRTIRAIEVFKLSGIKMSQWQKKDRIKDKRRYRLVVLNRERDSLYRRIEARVDQMITQGLFEETAKVLKMGYSPDSNSLNTVGYKEAIAFINGVMDRNTAASLIKQNTRRYAKRQMTWFRGMTQAEWLDVDKRGRLEKIAEELSQ